MECAICKKLNLRLVPVGFLSEEIGADDQERITSGIKGALEGEGQPRVIVTEADLNGYIECPAFKDSQGNWLTVHQGHCTGSYPGFEKCRYFVGDRPGSSSICWCGLVEKRKKQEAMQREAERARRLQEKLAAEARQRHPLDIAVDDIPLPWDR